MKMVLAALVVAFLGLVVPARSAEPPPPVRTVDIPSANFSDEEFLRGEAGEGTPVTLSARIIYATGEPKQPTVILIHGSDGPDSTSVDSWRWTLTGLGYTVVRLNSYSGRGLTQISNDQSLVGQFTPIYDLYRTVEVLADDPLIDSSRLVVMGFSRGGTATLYGALSRFHELYGPTKGDIAAYLPFYPLCTFDLQDGLKLVKAPVREFHGADDDWAPAAPCRQYIAELKAAGNDVQMTEYPGARHAFDSSLAKAALVLPDAQTSRNCIRKEIDFQLINPETGAPFTYNDACVELGPSVQYNEPATKAANEAVAALLSQIFGG